MLAPAKINLHLEVLGLRPDGYHELAMVMQTLDLADTLVLAPTADGAISLRTDAEGLSTGADNLIVRAAERLRSHAGLPELGVAIQLSKRIPIGAGLAGGFNTPLLGVVFVVEEFLGTFSSSLIWPALLISAAAAANSSVAFNSII